MKLETIKKAVEELSDGEKREVFSDCSLLTNSMKHRKNEQNSETVALL